MSTKGKGKNLKSSNSSRKPKAKLGSPLNGDFVERAKRGELYSLELVNKKDVKVTNIKRGLPYFNKALGTPGKDKLVLNSKTLQQKKDGKPLLYIISHRIVGTRDEIEKMYDDAKLSFPLKDLLAPTNVLTETNMENIVVYEGKKMTMTEFIDNELSKQSEVRNVARGDYQQVREELETIYNLAEKRTLDRKNAPKKVIVKEDFLTLYKKVSSEKDKVVNVSKMTPDGKNARITNVPTKRSKSVILNGPYDKIASSNPTTYGYALKLLGLNDSQIANNVKQLSELLSDSPPTTLAGVVAPVVSTENIMRPTQSSSQMIASNIQPVMPIVIPQNLSPRGIGTQVPVIIPQKSPRSSGLVFPQFGTKL